MIFSKRAGTAALIVATLAFSTSAATLSASAAPGANIHALPTGSDVTQVQARRLDGGGNHTGGNRHMGNGHMGNHSGNWRGRGDGGRGWNRGHRNRGYYDYGYAPGAYLGLGIAGAIIEGALDDPDDYADGADYADGPGYGGGQRAAMHRCAAQFRSFEWDTGLYTTYQGDKRPCPYLG